MNEMFSKEKNIIIATIIITILYLYLITIEEETILLIIIPTFQIILSALTILSIKNAEDIKALKRNTLICAILSVFQFNFINLILFIWARESICDKEQKLLLMSHNMAQEYNPNVAEAFNIKKEEISDEAKKIDVLLKIGVFLVILSGIIFSTSNAGQNIDLFKPIFVLMLSGIFYGLSILFKTKVKIKKSENTYYILSNIFIIFAVLASAYFKIFGNFFTFGGEGETLVYSIISLVTAIIVRNLANHFDSKELVIASYLLIYPSIIFALSFYDISGILITSILLIISFIGCIKINKENESYHISRIILITILGIYVFYYNFDIVTSEDLIFGLLGIGLLIANLYFNSKENEEIAFKQLFAFVSVLLLNISLYNLGNIIIPNYYLNETLINIPLYSSLITLGFHHYFVHKDEFKICGFITTAVIMIFNMIMLSSNNCDILLFIISVVYLIYSVFNIYKSETTALQKVYFVLQLFLIGTIIGTGQAILRDHFYVNIIFGTTVLLYLSIIALVDIFEDKFITEIKMDLPLYYVLIFLIGLLSIMFLDYNEPIFNIIFLLVLIAYRVYVNKHIKNQDIVNCMIVLTTLLHLIYLLSKYVPLYANPILFVITLIASFLLKKDKITSVFCASLAYLPLLGVLDTLELSTEINLIINNFALILIVQLVANTLLDMPKTAKTILETIVMMIIMFTCIFRVNLYIGLYIGILSLVMILIGTKNTKSNSLFVTGIISLILNIIVQLFEYWEKIPWFVYTLVAGLLIIFYVTYKELNKDKNPKKKDEKIEYHEEKEYNIRNNIVTGILIVVYIFVTGIYVNILYSAQKTYENKLSEEAFKQLNLDENKFYFSNKNHTILYILEKNSTDLNKVLNVVDEYEMQVCWVDKKGLETARAKNTDKRYYDNCIHSEYFYKDRKLPDKLYYENGTELRIKNQYLYSLDVFGRYQSLYDTTRFRIYYGEYETENVEFCINKFGSQNYNVAINADKYEVTNQEEHCYKAYSENGNIEIEIIELYEEEIPSNKEDIYIN